MTNITDIYVLDNDALDILLEDESLEHPDSYRLLRYIWLVQYYPANTNPEYYRDNLKKWVDDEQEAFYGEHESPEAFTRYYIENYCEQPLHNWIAVDYEATWESALRHDFHYEEIATHLGYVWAEIY